MEVKVLQDTVCENTGVMIPAGAVLQQVWDGRSGEYAGLIGDRLVSIPYDKGAIIVEEGKMKCLVCGYVAEEFDQIGVSDSACFLGILNKYHILPDWCNSRFIGSVQIYSCPNCGNLHTDMNGCTEMARKQ